MGRVHVGLDFEHKTGEVFFGRFHIAGDSRPWTGRRGQFHKGVKEFLDAEVIDGAAKEDRGLIGLHEMVIVKGIGCSGQEIKVGTQFIGLMGPYQLVKARVVKGINGDSLLSAAFLARGKEMELLPVEVVDTLEGLAHADGPGHGSAFDLQFFFDLGQDVEGFHTFAIEFVDEGDQRRVAHPAHLHQFFGLGFNPFGVVDNHDRRINGSEHPVGILGEILVAGGVEQIDLVVAVGEFHHRGGDRDAALLFNGHPVAGCVAGHLAGLDGPGQIDGATKEEELFGQGGLSGVRMADDAKGPSFGYFLLKLFTHDSSQRGAGVCRFGRVARDISGRVNKIAHMRHFFQENNDEKVSGYRVGLR